MATELTTGQEAALDAAAEFLRAEGLPAYADALGQREHVLNITDAGYGLQHPISCRPNLLACPVEIAANQMRHRPAPGQYIAHAVQDRNGFWLTSIEAHKAAAAVTE